MLLYCLSSDCLPEQWVSQREHAGPFRLRLVSSLSQRDDRACGVKEYSICRDQPLMTDDQSPEVLQPGKCPFHLPSPLIPPHFASAPMVGQSCMLASPPSLPYPARQAAWPPSPTEKAGISLSPFLHYLARCQLSDIPRICIGSSRSGRHRSLPANAGYEGIEPGQIRDKSSQPQKPDPKPIWPPVGGPGVRLADDPGHALRRHPQRPNRCPPPRRVPSESASARRNDGAVWDLGRQRLPTCRAALMGAAKESFRLGDGFFQSQELSRKGVS